MDNFTNSWWAISQPTVYKHAVESQIEEQSQDEENHKNTRIYVVWLGLHPQENNANKTFTIKIGYYKRDTNKRDTNKRDITFTSDTKKVPTISSSIQMV